MFYYGLNQGRKGSTTWRLSLTTIVQYVLQHAHTNWIRQKEINCLGYVFDYTLQPRHWFQFADNGLICMSLMGFSAWWTIGPRDYLKSCNFFHWLHCTPKLKDTAFSIAVYIQDRLEMKLGPSKPLFHSYLIAKGTKKRDAPSAA